MIHTYIFFVKKYYIHKDSNELSYVTPASVIMKLELEEEVQRNRKNYEEAQRKLEKMNLVTKGKRRMVIRRR